MNRVVLKEATLAASRIYSIARRAFLVTYMVTNNCIARSVGEGNSYGTGTYAIGTGDRIMFYHIIRSAVIVHGIGSTVKRNIAHGYIYSIRQIKRTGKPTVEVVETFVLYHDIAAYSLNQYTVIIRRGTAIVKRARQESNAVQIQRYIACGDLDEPRLIAGRGV
jgi:hypothetical protein